MLWWYRTLAMEGYDRAVEARSNHVRAATFVRWKLLLSYGRAFSCKRCGQCPHPLIAKNGRGILGTIYWPRDFAYLTTTTYARLNDASLLLGWYSFSQLLIRR
jgi:hypothetical protein